jgi:hypothetical protein
MFDLAHVGIRALEDPAFLLVPARMRPWTGLFAFLQG